MYCFCRGSKVSQITTVFQKYDISVEESHLMTFPFLRTPLSINMPLLPHQHSALPTPMENFIYCSTDRD